MNSSEILEKSMDVFKGIHGGMALEIYGKFSQFVIDLLRVRGMSEEIRVKTSVGISERFFGAISGVISPSKHFCNTTDENTALKPNLKKMAE